MGEKLKSFQLKSGMRNRMCPLSPFFQYSAWTPTESNKTREINKRDKNRKGRSQLFLLADEMILLLKDPKSLRSDKHFQQNIRL
jgi:hypothetical protein